MYFIHKEKACYIQKKEPKTIHKILIGVGILCLSRMNDF